MADDAGALLVRSGLVSANALEDARARVATQGGTVGEQLVVGNAITDDALTEFYRTRLLVPQVNPNMLARLTPKVVATMPSDMAIELRAIPVSLDGDNNLTVAMSDPSDRHAVDEIAFFTGAYVVRAVATQMQIAWCLAHYYGHVTALGQRLLHIAESPAPVKPRVVAPRPPRVKGLTGQVDAARHRAIAPITGPVDIIRPNSGALDLRPLAAAAEARPTPSGPPSTPRAARVTPGVASVVAASRGALPPTRSSAETRPLTPLANRPLTPPAGVSAQMAPRHTPLGAPPPVAAVPRATSGTSTAPIAGPVRPPAGAAPMASPPRATAVAAPPPMTPALPAAPTTPRALANSTPAPPAPTHASTPAARPPASAPGPRSRTSSPELASGSAPGLGASPPAAEARGQAAGASPGPTSGAGQAAGSFVPRAAPDAITLPPINNAEPAAPPDSDGSVESNGAPERSRARSVSGEIRLPSRRAASIRPPLPADSDADGDDDEPLIVIERGAHGDEDDDATGPSRLPPPPRRRAVKSDPPELYARAGEVDLKSGNDRTIDADEPRIVIDEDALAPPTGRVDLRRVAEARAPSTVMDILDDADTGALIHDRVIDRASSPPLAELPRTMTDQLRAVAAATLATIERDTRGDDDEDTGETDIVMLDAPKPRPRAESRIQRRTHHGVPPAPGALRTHRDTEASGVPTMVDHRVGDRTHRTPGDATSLDLPPASPGDDTTSDRLAPPPPPLRPDDTNPHIIAPPPPPVARAPIQRAVLIEDDEDDEDDDAVDTGNTSRAAPESDDDPDDEPINPPTSVMSSAQLDAAVPQRAVEILPAHLARRHVDYDPVDDGWGPPGTTIPPPLLGAIPGSDDEDDDGPAAPNVIPMPNVDSSPLLVGPPSRPSQQGESAVRDLVRALEEATARAIEVIRQLERAQSRDEVVDVMVAHLAETHHRAGFFVTRQGTAKGAMELGLFSMTPRPAVLPFANLRLDRPSTLQDVVGTRLPYRGPMHDDDSRSFLVSILGACPAEILLVPVAVRERVVGVLFGEHRQRHTFDDQLALAARAAGMALERILKAKRT